MKSEYLYDRESFFEGMEPAKETVSFFDENEAYNDVAFLYFLYNILC